MASLSQLGNGLYRGEVSLNIVGVGVGAGAAVEDASVAVAVGVGDADGCGEPKSMATTGRKFNCAVVFN